MSYGDTNDGPDDNDADLFDEMSDVIDCPKCGAEIYAYSEKCPVCGVWLHMRHRQVKSFSNKRKTQRWLWPLVGLICVLLILLFILR